MSYISYVYANLITKKRKTIDDVPKNIREEVKEILGIKQVSLEAN